MPNEYSEQWFEVFLDTLPDELTAAEADAIEVRLPRPECETVS